MNKTEAMNRFHACNCILHGPSMFAVKAKIYGVLYKQFSSIAFDETSSYWSVTKSAKFSAFHWSTSRSQAFISQLLGTSRVVHLPKRTVMVLFTITDA